ncbi:MAG: acyl carrier protein [Clostridiales bacterium]|nr:acyl carrier protein [Clostridiales bacterium]MDY5347933.1 acyl carrier protein [Candidatus Ventricola sp.]MDY5515793.1 acyl carrier protein [Candidatus Ventricola sp.]
MVMDKLRTMVAEQLGVSEDEVKPEARLKEDLKADSASVMMLVMDVETEFGIEVADDAIEKVKTVADMAAYIEEKM